MLCICGDDVGMSDVFKLPDKVGSFRVRFSDDLQCNQFFLAIVLSNKDSTIGPHAYHFSVIIALKKKKKKYLSIQLLIRVTCRVATEVGTRLKGIPIVDFIFKKKSF